LSSAEQSQHLSEMLPVSAATEVANHWKQVANTWPAELMARIRLALSLIQSRMDTSNPTVVLLQRVLDGMSIEDAAAGDVQRPQPRSA
jgi:hypothetical protein